MSTISSLGSLTDSIGSSGSSGATGTTGTGLGQGIDVQQFVKFAVANQQARITALQAQQTSLASQNSEISTLSTNLTNLDSAAFALRNPLGPLNAQMATSSNPSVVSATASGTAAPGNHTITVSSLATTSAYYTGALQSNATISAGSFQIAVGTSSPVTVTVDSSNNTLSELASSINNQDIGVSASVIQDANGYRLALVSSSSGAPGDLTVSGNTTSLTFNKAVTGTNASLTVDGIPISSASNTVNNVINGVTLNLESPLPNTPVTVNVSPDTSQASSAINDFVAAWNTVVTEINGQFNVSSDGSGGGVLESDNSLRDVQSMLLNAIAYSVPGNSGMVNLASIGVNMNDNGTLTVDNGALSSALSSNFSAVQNLLQNTTTGFAQNLGSVVRSINSPGKGILSLDAQSNTNISQSLAQQISDLQAALAVQEVNFTKVYSQVNTLLQQLPLLESQISQQLSSIK